MAPGSITRPRPTVEALETYLHDNSIDQAARRWGVHPRTISKWRARANTPARDAERLQDAPKPITPPSDAPVFVPTVDDVAGLHTSWRDPWTGDLMPVPPGVHRKSWEAERIAARDRHRVAVAARVERNSDPVELDITEVPDSIDDPVPSCPPAPVMSSTDAQKTSDLGGNTPAPLPLPTPYVPALPQTLYGSTERQNAVYGHAPAAFRSMSMPGSTERPIQRRDVPRLDVLGLAGGFEIERVLGVPLAVVIGILLILLAFAGT